MNGRRRPVSLGDVSPSIDWQTDAEALAKLPNVSETEWKEIFSLRSFRAKHHKTAKSKILRAIFVFRRLNLARAAAPDRELHLEQLHTAITLVDNLLSSFVRRNHQLTQLLLGLIDETDPVLPVLPPGELVLYQEATARILNRIGRVTSKEIRKKSGPDSSAVEWFLSAIDEILRAYSVGGRITRSTKNRPDIGNDMRFIRKIFEIAGREAGISVGSGTIDGAMRRLKASTKPTRKKHNPS